MDVNNCRKKHENLLDSNKTVSQVTLKSVRVHCALLNNLRKKKQPSRTPGKKEVANLRQGCHSPEVGSSWQRAPLRQGACEQAVVGWPQVGLVYPAGQLQAPAAAAPPTRAKQCPPFTQGAAEQKLLAVATSVRAVQL